jgi:hypothetical protein
MAKTARVAMPAQAVMRVARSDADDCMGFVSLMVVMVVMSFIRFMAVKRIDLLPDGRVKLLSRGQDVEEPFDSHQAKEIKEVSVQSKDGGLQTGLFRAVAQVHTHAEPQTGDQ